MKKTLCMLLAMMLLVHLAACSKDAPSKGPTEDMLQADIHSALSEYRLENGLCPITLKEYQIEKSLTEDKQYTAEINVTAESTYAEYNYSASVAYTMYDQGWTMDTCDWNLYDCNVLKYPGEDELLNLENGEEIKNMIEPELNGNDNYFTVTGSYILDWSPYVIGKSTGTITWEYNYGQDRWDYCTTEEYQGEFTLTEEFDTAWELVQNATDTGFDISWIGDYFTFMDIHVEMYEADYDSENEVIELFFSPGDEEIAYYSGDDWVESAYLSGDDLGAYYNNYVTKDSEGHLFISIEIHKEPTSSGKSMVMSVTMNDGKYYYTSQASFG